ncbi:MAG: adenylate/guanylate cyclase domain-containing protein [Bacteroidia bacterium]
MNQHLETVLNFIQQSKKLSAGEKNNISKAVKKADDELEYKNHELEIEASLERVRAKAMAMHNSSDLSATTSTVFVELRKLGIHPVRTGVTLLAKNSDAGMFYAGTSTDGIDELALIGSLDMTTHPVLKMQYESWLKKENYFPELNQEEQDSYYTALLSHPSVPIKRTEILRGRYGYYFPFKEGLFYAWTQSPFSENEINILNRFKSIIDLTFRRYLDLQKAEARVREAQIEAALERVRSKAMAMHKSDDLNAAVAIVFEELDKLNLGMLRCGIGILSKERRCADVWTTSVAEQGNIVQVSGDESMDIHPLLQGAFDAWLKQGEFSYVLEREDMSEYYSAVRKTNFHLPESQIMVEHAKELKHYYYATAFQSGMLFAFRETGFPEEAKAVMKRFAGVFNLTYKRFLDIQNAEALAYKAQVEEQKLREEKKRSDSLLLNILPEEIANELKQFGKSYARKHEEVTVLFADIKGFSSIAENLSAEELVTQLDECFRAFDKIVEKHGLEKIKTVGDAYVCACGLPKPVSEHAAKTVGAALDMIEFIKGFGMTKKIQNLPAFEFRVGIHTGPVVTGVVGLKKFTYDIWGDAVNMAARMEQHGEAGKINISGNTYQLVKEKFKCIHRGKIQAKNKGEIDMYFVETTS